MTILQCPRCFTGDFAQDTQHDAAQGLCCQRPTSVAHGRINSTKEHKLQLCMLALASTSSCFTVFGPLHQSRTVLLPLVHLTHRFGACI